MSLDSYPKEPSKEDTFPLFRLKEKGSPGIRLESKSPIVLRLCLVEQNQGFEDLLVGATVSAPPTPASSVRSPLPASLTVIHRSAARPPTHRLRGRGVSIAVTFVQL